MGIHLRATGRQLQYGITHVLPPTRQKWTRSALTPANEAGTRSTYPGLSSFKFSWWAPKDARVLKQCIMTLQGHPRSLILAPIESVYAISYWSSIVTLVLSCPVSEILQVSCWELPPLFHPNFRGVPFGLSWQYCGSEERRPQLIILLINFELVQRICSG